jgi:hypothetical protein
VDGENTINIRDRSYGKNLTVAIQPQQLTVCMQRILSNRGQLPVNATEQVHCGVDSTLFAIPHLQLHPNHDETIFAPLPKAIMVSKVTHRHSRLTSASTLSIYNNLYATLSSWFLLCCYCASQLIQLLTRFDGTSSHHHLTEALHCASAACSQDSPRLSIRATRCSEVCTTVLA